jgi:hypothetical protein
MDTTLYVVTDSPDGRSVNRANAYRFVLLEDARDFARRTERFGPPRPYPPRGLSRGPWLDSENPKRMDALYIHEVHYQYVESELVY